MNYKEFYVSLPIKDNNVRIVDGLIQYDTANIMHVRLMDGTEPFDFTGYTEIIMEVLKPDGTHVQALITDDPEINGDNNPYKIQVADPKEGRVSFTLQGQATVLTGTHFAQLIIVGNGKILTSARINYYVGDTLMEDEDTPGIVSSSEYNTLITLINRNSAIATAERDRIDTETLRRLAEIEREERMDEMEAEVQEYLDNADGYVQQTQTYMEQAALYAQLAQNPSAEIMETLVEGLNLASKSYTDTEIAGATKNFDAGNYTDSAAAKKLLKVRTGEDDDLPELDVGELGFSTDTQQFYVGGLSGAVPIGGSYIAAPTAPTRTDVLWIDTSTAGGGSIKYHDGNAWKPTATATFA